MAQMIAIMALVHLAALAVLFLLAQHSVRLVDENGRAIARGARGPGTLAGPFARREPEPSAGEVPDPSAYRHGHRAMLPKPRFLA